MGSNESKIQGFTLQSRLLLNMMSERAILEQIHEWIHSSKSVSIFLTGKTGSGKSTLVNALVGDQVAEEGEEPDPMTAEVEDYTRTRGGIHLKVWDSPGLQDGTGNEERYIADMQAKCVPQDIDLYLFCINVAESVRFNRECAEITALKKLTDVFGRSMWDNAVIALTFANELQDNNEAMMKVKGQVDKATKRFEHKKKAGGKGEASQEDIRAAECKLEEEKKKLEKLFCEKVQEWDKALREMLKDEIGLDSAQVQALQIIPTGFRKPVSLPDRPHWLSTFWFSVLRSTHKRAQPALLHMNRNRIVENLEDISDSDVEKHTKDQAIVLMQCGAEAGSAWGDAAFGSFLGLKMAQLQSIDLIERLFVERFLTLFIDNPEDTSSQPREDCSVAENSGQEAESTCGGPFEHDAPL